MRAKADLHNHSCLSPCGSLKMSPAVLARRAASQGIEILALTDHNTARNLPAFKECCEIEDIVPIFGMEVNTSEEVHVVCLFGSIEVALSFGEYVESHLPAVRNRPEIFGDQVIVDADENIIGYLDPLLFSSTSISFSALIARVLELDGLVIPAHIDRFSNGAVSQLGFLPDLPYTAVEVLHLPCSYETYDNTVITGSDAHHPEDVGIRSFYIDDIGEVSFPQLRESLLSGSVTLKRA